MFIVIKVLITYVSWKYYTTSCAPKSLKTKNKQEECETSAYAICYRYGDSINIGGFLLTAWVA